MNTDSLRQLQNYFKKNNFHLSRKISKLVVTASPQQIPSDPNKAIEDFARAQNAFKKISDPEINFGSVVQITSANGAVYKLTKEDVLSGGYWYLCMKVDPNVNIPNSDSITSLQSLVDSDPNVEGEGVEKVKNFFERYRAYSGVGGQSKIVTFFLSGHTPYQTDEFYSKYVKNLVLVKNETNVIQIEKFDVGSPSLSEFIDAASDIIVIGASLIALAATGPVAIGVSFVNALRKVANAAMLIGIFNNLLAGDYLEAILGIIGLLIGNPRSTKPLLRSYIYFFRGPNAIYVTSPRLLIKVPDYVLAIGAAFMETIQYVIETIVGAVKDYQKELNEKYGIDKEFATEEELLAAKNKAGEFERYIMEMNLAELAAATRVAKSQVVVQTGA